MLHRHTSCRPQLAALLVVLAGSTMWTEAVQQRRSLQDTPVNVSNEEELVSALSKAQPIVVLQSIFLDGPLPKINTTVTISGDPVSCKRERQGYCRIDCRKKCRQFDVTAGGLLSLTNLMIARGVAPETQSVGGALLVRDGGGVTCDRVLFRFNGARGATSGGGAVEVETGGVFRATNCLFSRNFAGFGGAIAGAKQAIISIRDTFFNRNTALTAGGAVSVVLNSTATLIRNDYHGNAAAIGGAIHIDASPASICLPWDSPNTASVAGPQVYGANAAKLTTCRLPNAFVVLASGATVVTDCQFCQ